MLEFIRVASAVPPVTVGDTAKNAADICSYICRADDAGCDVVVFPELALTGYTCADLFFQHTLLNESMTGLQTIMACSAQHPAVTAVVGTPAVIEGQMYNCAAVISNGVLRGLVTKTHLPNYGEFSERRWFSSSEDLQTSTVTLSDLGIIGEGNVPVGRDLLFKLGGSCVLGVEICEDLWTPLPPSTLLTINGAEIIVNLSASNEIAGKRQVRTNLVEHQSDVCSCVYAYCSSGSSESTQDLVFSGHSIIAENGAVLAQNKKVIDNDYLLVTDADLGKVRSARRKNKSVRDAASFYGKVEPMRTVDCHCANLRSDGTRYPLEKYPFIPKEDSQAQDIFEIQTAGLRQRLRVINAKPVVGLSGGLDSALAMLVAHAAVDDPKDVHAVIMPGFGTTDRTYNNALKLANALGATVKVVDIRSAVRQHFADIGHDEAVQDGVYENSQARERTQVLMDYAAKVGGIVVGTGDLSELALGWCTYNGDHMSMYSVNGTIPKTLVRWMVYKLSALPAFADAWDALRDIIITPVSPELLPHRQITENTIGPYVLHDFFLYHVARFAYTPAKIYALACRAFADDYDGETIKKWMKLFYSRFFSQQFKRNCLPDGVKVGNISMSPRGDWRMPSDASARIWLAEVERL
jgi:NAD+ synthase (glutamine-hydrolysing)